ncbi:lactam utilization protein LamB [Rhodanobacter sp. FW510-R12]|uniref:LamB/YcsF family protein n=1 Tax=unclassified Rhodanobacter TaxID=2621553 RepID=UPI0007A9F868|nr:MULTISPECIES: 5-oxoprolinase subunit PxpA [unclassified Rhodanobacter]KZC15689.1 lactam utilization protein LamB [Rhodanobacter sp. FW104-R8]KZC28947.1 lactam utilization protein LamB [Rhodanobacter sp. FW510-T8]KZC30846.1 lactam utilization protein LamB [Rhodanobacter sp. FW510-R10]
MNRIDLNGDLGESFGAWRMGDDDALLPLLSSANIACGFHAGDPGIMQRTVAQAVAHGVAIGAHVSLPDLQGFGRREIGVTPAEAYATTLYQIGALHAFTRAAGATLSHVKPHGALYNMAARDALLADAIARAVRDFDPRLRLFGLAGSALIEAGRKLGLAVAAEAFADRRYRADGSLQPRSEAGAVIEDVELAVAQALGIARDGTAQAVDGRPVPLRADTLCLHGDGPHAVQLACRLREALDAAGLRIAAPDAA